MKRGEVLKGKLRRARWRQRRAPSAHNQERVAFWESKLGQFRKNLRIRRASDRRWAGSRRVTNEIIDIVGTRAPITSRKRWQTFGNPGSDHYMGNRTADAVDFGIENAYALGREIAKKLGGYWDTDYDSFFIVRRGRQYRVQLIAGTHGTGPHLHAGVRLV